MEIRCCLFLVRGTNESLACVFADVDTRGYYRPQTISRSVKREWLRSDRALIDLLNEHAAVESVFYSQEVKTLGGLRSHVAEASSAIKPATFHFQRLEKTLGEGNKRSDIYIYTTTRLYAA